MLQTSRAPWMCRSPSRNLAQRIAPLVACERVGLALLTEVGDEFQTYTARVREDRRVASPPGHRLQDERTAIGHVVRSREPLISTTRRTGRPNTWTSTSSTPRASVGAARSAGSARASRRHAEHGVPRRPMRLPNTTSPCSCRSLKSSPSPTWPSNSRSRWRSTARWKR